MSEEDTAPAPNPAAEPAPARASPPLFKTWVNCTPTGLRLPDLGPQGAAPYMVERYEEQSDNQDFLIKIDDTHPSVYDTNDRSFVRAQVSFYEHCSAMLIPVFKTNKLNTENLQFLDPNHYYLPHPTRSTRETDPRIGTVLHAVDLVWLKLAHAKVPYDLITSTMVEHRASVIGSLVTGMWVSRKADPSEVDAKNDKRYAIMFPFRPFHGETREPQLLCVELSQKEDKEHFLPDSVVYRNIDASEIRAFGNNTNIVNKSVSELMEDALENEFHYFSGYPLPAEGGFSDVFEAQNKLTKEMEKRRAVSTAFREFAAQTIEASKGTDNNFGIRWEHSVMTYKVPVFENGQPVDLPPEDRERICNKTHEIYDKTVIKTLLKLSHAAHLCYEYDFRSEQSTEEIFESRKTNFEEEVLCQEEWLIKELKKLDWTKDSVKHTNEFLDIVPIPDFEVCLACALVRMESPTRARDHIDVPY